MRAWSPLALIAVLGSLALPAAAPARVIELGQTEARPAASCPTACQAIGRVTGFQVQMGEARNPFRVNRRGKIVAFTLRLGTPSSDQRRFFDATFGGPPRARLTVLRPGAKRRYRLTGQSEAFDLAPYLGSAPTFALARPLTVKKDYVVAITVPTWAPAFSVDLPQNEAWRSSRDAADCNDVQREAAQEVRGSLRTYGCFYRTARLLYTATFVPDPRKTQEEPAAEQPRTGRPAPTRGR